MPLEAEATVAEEWKPILTEVMSSLRPYVQELAGAGLPTPTALPKVEYFNEELDDDAFAELAWPTCSPPIAVLAGEQVDFATQWQQQGWRIVTQDDLQAKGMAHLIDQLIQGFSGA